MSSNSESQFGFSVDKFSKLQHTIMLTRAFVAKRYFNVKATDAQINVLFLDWFPMVTSATVKLQSK